MNHSAKAIGRAWGDVVNLLLHRLAALYLRLRGKRPPLIDMIEAWSSGRWDPRCYRAAARQGPPAGDGAA